MSRCSPYPPPGYAGKCASSEALIMSIKLQRENEKATKSDKKKERKKEKKEKKEKKKDQQKEKVTTAVSGTSVIESRSAHDDPKGSSKYELELLQKSNLTEEHGQPCNSSESTENSTKRKRDAVPPKINQNHGNIIRIRVPSQKRENSATSSNDGGTGTMAQQDFRTVPHNLLNPLPEKSTVVVHRAWKLDNTLPSLAACSATALQKSPKMQSLPGFQTHSHAPSTSSRLQDTTMQRMESEHRDPLASQKMYPPLPENIGTSTPSHDISRSDDKKVQKRAAKLADQVQSNNMLPPVAGRVDAEMRDHALSTSRCHDKKMQKKTAKYRELSEKWVPPPLHSVLPTVDDEDWLFIGKKEKDFNPSKGPKVEENNLPSCGSFALQPRALFLADVGIYVFPYTVPF